MPSDLVGAVVQALEQQQSAASGSETPPVVQIVEPSAAASMVVDDFPQSEIPVTTASSRRDMLQQLCGLLKRSMISRQLRGS